MSNPTEGDRNPKADENNRQEPAGSSSTEGARNASAGGDYHEDRRQIEDANIIEKCRDFFAGDVVYNFNIKTEEEIWQLMAYLLEHIPSESLTGPQAIELVKSCLNAKISKLPIDEEKRSSLQGLIASSEGINSIVTQLKSYAVLTSYLGDRERRAWLAEFMTYGCRRQIIKFRELQELHENREILLAKNREDLAKSLRYCLAWLHDFCSRLKPRLMRPNHQVSLQAYPLYIFEQAFAVLEDYLKREPTLTNGEVFELQECVKILYEKNWSK